MKSGNNLAASVVTGLFAFSALFVAGCTARAASVQSGEAKGFRNYKFTVLG